MKLSHVQKLEIVRLHNEGLNKTTRIVKNFKRRGSDMSRDCVRYWVRKYVQGEFGHDDGARTGTTFTSVTEVAADRLEKNLVINGLQSCRAVHNDFVREGSTHSLMTTRNLIKSLGFTTSSPRYGQMVRDINKDKRVQFCNHLIQADDDLSNVIFTDESSISLEQSKPASYHRQGTINPVIPKAKHPAKVHVWGGISRRGATELAIFQGIMEKTFFTNEILENRALLFIQRAYPEGHRFQQDNDPKHRSKLARDFMRDNGIHWMDDWPSESPDLNPIEMVWASLKTHVYRRACSTVDELLAAITEYWRNQVTVEMCSGLCKANESLPPADEP
ncbi:TCB2-like protein [Mya arenaria]|uniref:TCB2-like protein n=1 Tax=Mya arenaria TaxID=6604 RepID=A0ABY7FXV6_MYAAR|nr:TCB2-like protein [Mya arenaria]